MEYLVRGIQKLTLEQHADYVAREVASFERVAAWVEEHVSVDTAQYFCGGFSKGGWTTSGMGEAIPDTWAGFAIMGAGRQYFDRPLKNPRALRGKPIYIGCGTKDTNHPHAKQAADFYRKHGAVVTFEPYEGLGHEMKWETKVLPNWLYAHGPQRDLKGRLARAMEAEKAGKLGLAYSLYEEIAAAAGDGELGRSAAEVAKRLGAQAETLLAAAQKAVEEKRYGDTPRLLARVTSRFEGSPFAERADALILKLQSDPAIQAAVRQARLDAEAEALEERARAADAATDYAAALRLYRQYVAKYEGASRFQTVKARLDALEANEGIQAKVIGEQAARECRVWLNLADNYARAGKPETAREYLERILAKYIGSDWAAQARQRLAALEP
jgi:tetratricopeptide (TPR) repeat protein